MPHASSPDNTMAPQVNGEKPSSAFISHLISYPVVSDSITTFKSHPLGQKSIAISASGYDTFAKPVIPYLSKPYTYISPYVTRADSLGDSTLSNIDSRFPAVKKPTSELYDNATGLAFYPLKMAGDGKEYVFGVWGSEVKKVGGDGVVAKGKAAITTSLVVTSDALSWLSAVLGKKKAEVKEVAKEKIDA